MIIELSGGTVAVFGTLPKESLVRTKEGGTLHLRLVFEDRISLEAKFLGTHGDSHLDVIDLPLCPRTSVHPYATVIEPRFTLHDIDRRKGCIETDLVRTMRVGQVSGDEYLMWADLPEEVDDDIDVFVGEVALLDHPSLVEWQVEEVDVIVLESDETASRTGFFPTDRTFHEPHFGGLCRTVLLLVEEVVLHLLRVMHHGGVFHAEFDTDIGQVREVSHYFFVSHCNIARGLISDMDIVSLHDKSSECTARYSQNSTDSDHDG